MNDDKIKVLKMCPTEEGNIAHKQNSKECKMSASADYVVVLGEGLTARSGPLWLFTYGVSERPD